MKTRGIKKGDKKWKGGRYLDRNGYWTIHAPDHPNANSNRRVVEHRLVAEKMIGRFLKKEEMVHHINHNRQDNSPYNLYLCKDAKEHKELHVREKSFDVPLSNLL